MGFNCLKATVPLQGDSLLFTIKFPEIPGTHLIDLGMTKILERYSTEMFYSSFIDTSFVVHLYVEFSTVFVLKC